MKIDARGLPDTHHSSRFGLRQEVIALATATLAVARAATTTALSAIREFARRQAAASTPKPAGATPKPGPTEPYITATDLRERSRHAVTSILKALKPWPQAHEAVQDCLQTLFNPKPSEVRLP